MTQQSRRAFLAGSASGLALLTGCSSLPGLGAEDAGPKYDRDALAERAADWTFEAPSTYPAAVPDALAEAHRARAEMLLEAVPSDPAVPNEAVTRRLEDMRRDVGTALEAPPTEAAPLDRLADWRNDRGRAAEVLGAYRAASGELDASTLRGREERIRRDLGSFEQSWTHRADGPAEALAVHREIESLVGACRRYLVPDRPFPDDPQAAVFEAGELIRASEQARAALDDATGLRDAYVDSGMAPYWSDLGTAATRLDRVAHVTRRPVAQYVRREAGPEDFERDVEGTPAAELFRQTRRLVFGEQSQLRDARERGDYATAVAAAGRLLVGLVAMQSVVDAIRDGQYGSPESTAAVEKRRKAAAGAVEDALAVAPKLVSVVVAAPASHALEAADTWLSGRRDDGASGETPDRSDVVRALGHYALAEHLAGAVPAVVDRVTAELRGSA